jgi:hypothetical protein
LAQIVIDKTQSEQEKPAPETPSVFSAYLPKTLKTDWRPVVLYRIIEKFKKRG